MQKKLILILLTGLHIFCAHAQDTTFSNPFFSGNTMFSVNDKFGLMGKNNKVIIPCQYDALTDVRYGLIKATLNSKVGFINANNKTIIPFIYDEDTTIIIGARIYRSEEHDGDGKLVKTSLLVSVDNNYTNFSGGLCAVTKNGKFGFIDTLGNTIIPFQYDGADNFNNGIAVVIINGRYGAINSTGKLAIPAIYNKLVIEDQESIFAKKDGEVFWIDYAGKRLARRD